MQKELNVLSEEQGASLLETLGVIGFEEELKEATKKLGGHALSLILLGKLLVNEFDGDIQLRDQLPNLWEEEKLGNHTHKILHYYWNLWTDETHEKALLCLLGLFDRPMGLLEKEHLIDNANIANPLKLLNNLHFKKVEKRLEKAGLLLHIQDWQSFEDGQSFAVSRMEWDCHPLIREFVGEQFKKQHFNLFQQAHLKLFEFYQQLPEKHQPDTPEELAPLYRAVVHGCLAGEYKKAGFEVYWERILRKDEHYSWHKLGLYSEDLSALAAFFPQGWSQPVQQGLSEAEQAWLLAEASFCLMSLGRLIEAVETRKADIEIFLKAKDWRNASRDTQSLVELMLPLGQLKKAVTIAKQAIDYAQKAEDWREIRKNQTYLAMVLHRQGNLEESKNNFEKAEQLQQEGQLNYPQLYSIYGFYYCALLLDQTTDQNGIEKILKRGEYSLKLMQGLSNLVSISLDQLTLARAYFKLDKLKKAESYFNQAVESVRKAGMMHYLPEFLLDRANFLIKINKLEEAKRDLEEAKQLISRSGMKLYEVDYHLAMCRFSHLTKEKRSFDKHLSVAKTLIKSTGYHLRDKSVSELETLTF